MYRFTSAVVVLLVLASSLEAQFPFGHATPIGPYTPSLGAEPLWLGNIGFGYHIKNAPPGGSALVAVSAQRVDQVISGLQIYVDVANILISHVGPLDVSGQAFLPFPLGGPENPALAGIQAYAQAAVDDPASPGSFGTTAGLLLEVTLHPVFAASNTGQNLFLLDAVTPNATTVTGFPAGTHLTDAAFGNGGRDLFLAADTGVFLVDTLAATPAAALLDNSPGYNSIAWDSVHHRLYALSPFSGIVKVIDGDRASPTFGTVLTQAGAFPGSQQQVAVSADGSVLVLTHVTGALERRVADPSSPAYLQTISGAVSPVNMPIGTSVARPHVSPDGRVVSITVSYFFLGTAEIHRHDGVTNQWIDFDPVLAGYQPLNSLNHPSVPPSFKTFPFRDGTAMILAGATVAQLDLDPTNPGNVVASTTPVAPLSSTSNYFALSPSGRFLVQSDSSGAVISLVEIATGVPTPWVTLPVGGTFSSSYPTAWR